MKTSENPDVIQLDLPQKDSNTGWLSVFLRYYSMLAAIMSDSESSHAFQVEMITNLMIATIADSNIQIELREFKKEKLKEKIELVKNSNDSNVRDMAKIEALMEVVGLVSSRYVDTFLGVTQKIEVVIE